MFRAFSNITCLALVFGFSALGADARSKLGVDLRAFKGDLLRGVGWIAGLRAGHYVGSSNVYVGLGANYGAPTGNSPSDEKIYYGGVTLGYDGKLGKNGVFELGLLVGYGEGEIRSLGPRVRSYYVVEPSLGAGFSLGMGWRLTLSAGYLYMNGASRFSGGIIGFRLDHRSSTNVKDLKD